MTFAVNHDLVLLWVYSSLVFGQMTPLTLKRAVGLIHKFNFVFVHVSSLLSRPISFSHCMEIPVITDSSYLITLICWSNFKIHLVLSCLENAHPMQLSSFTAFQFKYIAQFH